MYNRLKMYANENCKSPFFLLRVILKWREKKCEIVESFNSENRGINDL